MEPRRRALFVTAGIRVDRITREALAGDADAFSPRPPFDSDTVVSANPKVVGGLVRRRDRRQLHQAARLGRHRHPAAGRVRDRVHRQPVAQARAQPRASTPASIRRSLGGRGLVEATVFFNNYDDLIVAVGSFNGSSRYRTDNISNARARGVEIAGTARAPLGASGGASLQVRLGYTFLATEILAVDRSGAAPPPFTVGDRLLRRPDHMFSADVLVSGRTARGVPAGRRHAARVRDVDPSFGTFGGIYDAPGYSVWNAGASWTIWSRLQLFGRVTNLFDRDYEEALGFPALGRSAMVGLRVAAGR